jgi:hypothetical protein
MLLPYFLYDMKEPLNEFTSFNTLGLYILYSISKRLYLNQTLVIILAIAWSINLSLIIYLIYKIVKDKEAMEKSTRNWLYFRTIANLGFIYLTLRLI